MVIRTTDSRRCIIVNAKTGAALPGVYESLEEARTALKAWRKRHQSVRPNEPFYGGIVSADEPKRWDARTLVPYYEKYLQLPVGWSRRTAIPKVDYRPRVNVEIFVAFKQFCEMAKLRRSDAVRAAIRLWTREEIGRGAPKNVHSKTDKCPVKLLAKEKEAFERKCQGWNINYSVGVSDALYHLMFADPALVNAELKRVRPDDHEASAPSQPNVVEFHHEDAAVVNPAEHDASEYIDIHHASRVSK